jgi:DNA-binding transcriptional LysR family regulator
VDIELVLRQVEMLDEIDSLDMDLVVTSGWPPEKDYVVRPLAHSRNVVCASPQYWLREGKPDTPQALEAHRCLLFRSAGGSILDRWAFERKGEQQTINVNSRMVCDGLSWAQEAACASAGVIRAGDLVLMRAITAGLLTPVLTDWEPLDSPSHFVLYRPAQRRSKLVRVFVDFLVQLFSDLQAQRPAVLGHAVAVEPRPDWFGVGRGRQSVHAARKRANTNLAR